MFRYVLEMAHFYHLAGDRVKAIASYQRAHALDASSATGMDTLAVLLFKVTGRDCTSCLSL